jgi:hypothetical protein
VTAMPEFGRMVGDEIVMRGNGESGVIDAE